MASTYTGQNAYDDALTFVRNITVPSATQIRMVDRVNSEIWNFYPWDWTEDNLTAVALVDGQQDYDISGDSDLKVLTKVWLRRTDTTPDEYWGPLEIVDWLAPDLREYPYNGMGQCAYVLTGDARRLRFESAFSIPTGVTVNIEGEYWQNPTKITALSSTFNFPDEFYNVLVDGLTYHLMVWADDPRAGSMRVDKGGIATYTGQLGAYMNALQEMAMSYQHTSSYMYPATPLGTGRNNFFGPLIA